MLVIANSQSVVRSLYGMVGSDLVQGSLDLSCFCVKRGILSLITKYSLSSFSSSKGIKDINWKMWNSAVKSLGKPTG